jgi:hypothetical protein
MSTNVQNHRSDVFDLIGEWVRPQENKIVFAVRIGLAGTRRLAKVIQSE